MTRVEWLDGVDIVCAAIIKAYKDLDNYTNTVANIIDITEENMPEVLAVFQVKIRKMADVIANI